MRPAICFGISWLICLAPFTLSAEKSPKGAQVYPEIKSYIAQRQSEFAQIPDDRKALLEKIAQYVMGRNTAKQPARLTFVCTHNSRRSQLAQIWAATAAGVYGVEGVEPYSGGIEVTAFNPRAIAAAERAGFSVEKTEDGKNPHYAVRFIDTGRPLVCFSKRYGDDPNPKTDFCVVMTCAQADAACPLVIGASLRVALHYEDPKVADNTPEEKAKYDERCQQIAREMLYLFSKVGG